MNPRAGILALVAIVPLLSPLACDSPGGVSAFGPIGPGGSATLSAISLSAGALTPAFNSATTSYTATVPNTTTSITVTPTAATSGSTIRVNGNIVPSGGASGVISLAVGNNTVSIVVTAANNSSRTYTITVTRSP